MKKTQAIFLLLMISINAFSQTQSEKEYLNEILRDTESTQWPKGIKDKTISFTDKGYEISGKFLKKVPVAGTIIKITDSRNNRTLYGQYVLTDGKPSVHGRLDYRHNGKQVSSYGKFIVNNGADMLVMKPRKASELSIDEIQIDIWAGFWENYPCILEKTPYGYSLSIDASDGGWHYSELCAKVSDEDVDAFGYEDIGKLLLKPSEVNISYADSVKFVGHVIAKHSTDGDIEYILMDGEKTGLPYGQKIEVKNCTDSKISKRYILVTSTPESSGIVEDSLFLPSSMKNIDPDSLWVRSYYLKHSPSISVKYKNSDKYRGKFVVDDGDAVMTDGIYLYKNGDKFEGDISGEYFGDIPVDGKTTFYDGSVKEGNWLKEYALTASQLKEISDKCSMPSDAKRQAESFVKENNFNELVEDAEKYEKRGDFVKAQSLYNKALDYKNNDEISERIELLDKKIERQRLVKKYGSRYADNILNGILVPGMTKKMCEEVVTKVIGLDFYRISKWTNFSGEQMETWEFDYEYGIDKENQRMLKEGIENKDKSTFLVYGLMNAFKGLTSGAASSMVKYKYLKFRNSVLIEMNDRSYYDDMNNAQREAENALNSLYWFY